MQNISDALSTAPNLQFLDLSNNLLDGNLSDGCGLAKTGYMEQIALASNNLSGGIPSCISSLKNLVELRLDDNRLSGTVPRSATAKSSKLVFFTAGNQAMLLQLHPASHHSCLMTYFKGLQASLSIEKATFAVYRWVCALSKHEKSPILPVCTVL